MSWPADGLPRFVAGAIGNGGSTSGVGGSEPAWWYVYDRANCHLPVVSGRASIRAVAEEYAERATAYMNAGLPLETAKGLLIAPQVEHGLAKSYQGRAGCRCDACSAAAKGPAEERRRRLKEQRSAA